MRRSVQRFLRSSGLDAVQRRLVSLLSARVVISVRSVVALIGLVFVITWGLQSLVPASSVSESLPIASIPHASDDSMLLNKRNTPAQELADRIAQLNGLPTVRQGGQTVATPAPSEGLVAKHQQQQVGQPAAAGDLVRVDARRRDQGAGIRDDLPLAARAQPRSDAERAADEEHTIATDNAGDPCPPVGTTEAAPPENQFGDRAGVTPHTRILPPIPTLYEPLAPRALWMPPIAFSTDVDHPHSFNLDPDTFTSTTRSVYESVDWLTRSWNQDAQALHNMHASTDKDGSVLTQDVLPDAPNFAPQSLIHPDFLPPAPLRCEQNAIRTKSYWSAWAKQQTKERPLNVLVWHGTWKDTTDKAQQGGPMGELALFTSTMLALTALSANVTFFAWPEGESALVSALAHYKRYDIILIDTYSSKLMEDRGFMSQPDFRCRLRALDYWGTPARQNSWKLPDLQQYLVPFACTTDGSTPNFLLRMHRFKNVADDSEIEPYRWTAESKQRRADADQSDRDAHALRWVEAREDWPVESSELFRDTFATAPHSAALEQHHAASARASEGVGDSVNPELMSHYRANIASLFARGTVRFPRLFAKRFQILVWGKEPSYFTLMRPLLTAIAKVVPLVTIVREEGRQFFPDESEFPKAKPGTVPRVRHLGVMDQRALKQTLMESALVLGAGDPIFSFTPLEALQVGTPFLNPLNRPPKTYWMNGDCVITSQHPYVEKLGAPQSWNFDPNDITGAVKVVRTALKWVRETQDKYGGIPPMYPAALRFESLVKRLNENWRNDVCQAQGLDPTPAHRRQKLGL